MCTPYAAHGLQSAQMGRCHIINRYSVIRSTPCEKMVCSRRIHHPSPGQPAPAHHIGGRRLAGRAPDPMANGPPPPPFAPGAIGQRAGQHAAPVGRRPGEWIDATGRQPDARRVASEKEGVIGRAGRQAGQPLSDSREQGKKNTYGVLAEKNTRCSAGTWQTQSRSVTRRKRARQLTGQIASSCRSPRPTRRICR